MILETQHRNTLIFQLFSDHFDVVHASDSRPAAIVTCGRDAHCQCFGIRDGSVGTLNVYCDGRAQIFGGSIDEVHLYGDAALSYYGPGCSQGTIKNLHVYEHALLKTDLKSLQHLLDTGSEIHIAVGATICIGYQYYTKKIEQTTDTFLGNIKTVEKVIAMMDEKVLGHAEADNWRVNGHDTGIPLESMAARVKTAMEKHTYVPLKTEVKVSQTADGRMKADITIEPGDIWTGPFTVRQLIEALQKCKNQDAPVNAYLLRCGTRLPITRVDDGFDDNRMVDLNVNDDYLFDNKKGDDRCADQQ